VRNRLLVIILTVITLSIGTMVGDGQVVNIGAQAIQQYTAVGQWYVSTHGNDTNDCASPAKPCATINGAIDKASAGDTVNVAIGTYTRDTGPWVVYIDKGVTLSGGWDEGFNDQSGLSIIDGEKRHICLEIYSGLFVTISRFGLKHGVGSQSGGIYNSGFLTVQDSIVEDNFQGINNFINSVLTLERTVVRNNSGTDRGAGIYNFGKLIVVRSAVIRNVAFQGGGIYNSDGQIKIINSTIGHNAATSGGGIVLLRGDVQIYNSTIINNTAFSDVGGVNVYDGASLKLSNSIIADNRELGQALAPDCLGIIGSGGYNLIGNTNGCTFNAATGDLLNIKPQAIPIETYYGLLPISPAIDAGDPSGCKEEYGGPVVEDQRGSPRPMDGNQDGISVCDIGAYELDPSHPIIQNFIPIASKQCPILYFDDFSDPNSGWPVVNIGDIRLDYTFFEKYHIGLNQSYIYAVARPGFQSSDFRASVELYTDSPSQDSYGIAFGISQDWSGWYTFEIYPDGWFGIYRYDQSGGAVLAEAYSPFIHVGNTPNQLTVERSGAFIKAFANGDLLATVSDSKFIGLLYLGLINITYDTSGSNTYYDDFKVEPTTCINLPLDISTGSQSLWLEHHLLDGTEISFNKHQP
jgi:hypothetical protein